MSVIGGRGKEKDEEEKLSHPFDMGYEDFSQIKSLFPQFQQRRTVRATGVAKGVDLQVYISYLKLLDIYPKTEGKNELAHQGYCQNTQKVR